jgi:hypothetical protein
MAVLPLPLVLVCLVAIGLSACSRTSADKPTGNVTTPLGDSPKQALTPLVNKIWRRSDSLHGQAAGSIYIFLENGTLLETSCGETYRVALWSADKGQHDTLYVVEDGRQVFTATLGEISGNTLHLHQKLRNEIQTRDITLIVVEGEFVCPDLPK